jgi:hypothetical protein
LHVTGKQKIANARRVLDWAVTRWSVPYAARSGALDVAWAELTAAIGTHNQTGGGTGEGALAMTSVEFLIGVLTNVSNRPDDELLRKIRANHPVIKVSTLLKLSRHMQ